MAKLAPAVLAAALLAAACAPPPMTVPPPLPDRPATVDDLRAGVGRPLVIAHRGFSARAPENTLAALEMALELGVDMVELDVTETADGHAVLLHDDTLERTTDGRGPAMAVTLDQLRGLDAGSWFSRDFVGERVPTLAEALETCRGRALVNVEIKGEAVGVDARSGVVPKVVEAVRAAGMAEQVVISSFEPRALVQVRELAPDLFTAALYNPTLHAGQTPEQVAGAVGARGFNVSRRQVDRPLVEASHGHGLPVSVYTVNWTCRMKRLLDLGVDALFTDRPDRLLRLLHRHPERWRR